MTFEVGWHKTTSKFATFNQQQKLSIGTNDFGEEKKRKEEERTVTSYLIWYGAV